MWKLLGAILRALANWLDPVDITISPPSDPISSIVTAGLNLAGGTVKLSDDILNIINSPEQVAARANVSLQEAKDALALHNKQAMATGQGDQVNRDLS